MRRLLERYARWAVRNPWPVLGATTVLAVIGVLLALRTGVTSDLGALLPEGATSVRNLDLAAERFGSTDALYINVQSPSREANRRYVDDVAAVLARWPEHPLVLYRPDVRYFKDRRLLFADLADMEAVRDNLGRRIKWEKVHSNPAYIDLQEDPAPEIIPREIRKKYEDRYRAVLGATFDRGTGVGVDAAAGDAGDDYLYLEQEIDARRPDGTTGKETVTTMRVRFPGTAVDMDFTENVVYRAECLLGNRALADCAEVARWPGAETLPAEARIVLDPKSYDPGMRAETGGGFRNRVAEADALLKDVRASAAGSLVAMIVIVLAAFRRVRALVYVMVPLLFGIVMCLAIAYLLLGRLNLITAFTFAVLLGLGIDFGIHLGKRYEEERSEGLGNEDAIARAFRQTGKGIVVATVTTVLAFAMLVTAHFRGFSEFGELTAIGVPISMATAFALFPAVVTLAERIRPLRPRRRRVEASDARRISPNVGRLVLVGVAVTTVAALGLVPMLGFEYDYGKLSTKRPVSSRIDSSVATRGYTGSPAVAMAESPEQAEVAYRYFRRRMNTGENLLRAVFSLYSFVPENQVRKLRVLREMDVLMDDPSFGFFEDRLSDEDLDRLDEWREYLRVGPVEPLAPDFPAWGRQLFTELDGRSVGRVLYLMPQGNMSNGIDAQRLQAAFQVARLPDGSKVPVASSGFVFADIIHYIRTDGRLATSLALCAVFAVLFIQFRSLRKATIMMVPLLIGFSWLFGILVILEVNLTFYSMVMLPVLLGTGIDASIHLYQRYLEMGPGSIVTVIRRTGSPVFLSTLTTAASFGSLMLTEHRGLFSMGQLAAIGMGTMLAATFIVMPAIIISFEGRGGGKGPGASMRGEVPSWATSSSIVATPGETPGRARPDPT